MADEPSNGELQRLIERNHIEVREDYQSILNRLDQFVLREVYASDEKARNARFKEVERGIDAERTAREAADKALSDRMDKTSTNWRTNFWQTLAAVLILVGIAVNVWTTARGR